MTTTINSPSIDSLMNEMGSRLRELEQSMHSVAGYNNEFDEIIVGPPGDQIIIKREISPATGLTLTPGTFFERIFIDAEWTPPVDDTAVEYELEVAEKTGPSTYELLQTRRSIGASQRIEGLKPQTTYGFKVYSINRIGVYSDPLPPSGYQDQATTIDATLPGAVANIVATGGLKTILVTWDENTEADVKRGNGLYQIQLDTANTFSTGNLISKKVSATITSFSGLTTGTAYFIRVRAIDSSGNEGPWSPASPGWVTVTPGAATSSDLAPGSVTASKVGFVFGGGNGLIHSSFETDANSDGISDDWVAYSSGSPSGITRSLSTSNVQHGTKSQRIQGTWVATADRVGILQNVSDAMGFRGGDAFTASVYATAATWRTNAVLKFYIDWLNAASGVTGTTVGTFTPTATRTRFTFSGTIPASTVKCNVYLFGEDGGTHGTFDLYLDAAQLETGDVVSAYSPPPGEIQPGSITATEIADNAVTSPKIIAGAVVAGKIAANAVSATELQSDSVTSTKIAAGVVTAEKLTIGIWGAELVLNGSFEESSAADATLPAKFIRFVGGGSGGAVVLQTTSSNVKSGSKSVLVTMSTPSATECGIRTSDLIPFPGSTVIALEAWARGSVATTRGFYLQVECYDQAQSFITNVTAVSDQPLSTAFALYTGQATTFSTTAFIRIYAKLRDPNVNTNLSVDSLSARQPINSVQIADGSINTNQLIAGAVIASKIAAGTITGDRIAAATITGDRISAATITGDRIVANDVDVNRLKTSTLNSQTITIASGGSFKIGNPPSSNGVLINDQGIRVYGAGGALKVTFDVSGNATFKGNVDASTITATDITGGTITSATISSGTITGTEFYTAASKPYIKTYQAAVTDPFGGGSSSQGSMEIFTENTTYNKTPGLFGIKVGSSPSQNVRLWLTAGKYNSSDGDCYIMLTGTAANQSAESEIRIRAEHVRIGLTAGSAVPSDIVIDGGHTGSSGGTLLATVKSFELHQPAVVGFVDKVDWKLTTIGLYSRTATPDDWQTHPYVAATHDTGYKPGYSAWNEGNSVAAIWAMNPADNTWNAVDAGYATNVEIWAADFNIASAENTKYDIRPLESDPEMMMAGKGSRSTAVHQDLLNLRPVIFKRPRPRSFVDATKQTHAHRIIDNLDRDHLGLVAEEVVDHMPEVVLYDENGEVQGLSYSGITAALIAGYKALSARVQELEGASK